MYRCTNCPRIVPTYYLAGTRDPLNFTLLRRVRHGLILHDIGSIIDLRITWTYIELRMTWANKNGRTVGTAVRSGVHRMYDTAHDWNRDSHLCARAGFPCLATRMLLQGTTTRRRQGRQAGRQAGKQTGRKEQEKDKAKGRATWTTLPLPPRRRRKRLFVTHAPI